MKYYPRLCGCLSQDYMKTIERMNRLLGIPKSFLDEMILSSTVEVINETIVSSQIVTKIKCDSDSLVFCDVIEKLVDCSASRKFLITLRHGKLVYYLYDTNMYTDCLQLANRAEVIMLMITLSW